MILPEKESRDERPGSRALTGYPVVTPEPHGAQEDNPLLPRALMILSTMILPEFFSIHVSFAPREGILDDTPDGADAVFPINLLTFGVGASMVGDGNFVDADALLGELGGDLRLKSKAVFLDVNLLNNFATKSFVTSLHVTQV